MGGHRSNCVRKGLGTVQEPLLKLLEARCQRYFQASIALYLSLSLAISFSKVGALCFSSRRSQIGFKCLPSSRRCSKT